MTTVDVLVVDKSQPLKIHFCDPSRARKRRQATLKLGGFVYHRFDDAVENPPVAVSHSDTTTVESTSTDAQDTEPATEVDRSISQIGISEIVGVRSDSEPSSSLQVVADSVWHSNDSKSLDAAVAALVAQIEDALRALPPPRVEESESDSESELMDLINWPED
ncbi:hypothetical protein P692DRAFT_20823168 [Suillus brevipes Sb2]|nr:hypothetical protein P692DRAFT_20823168 [Suillus brevipes Sb2]